MKRRRVAVVTGTRAEYRILRTVMRHIADHPKLRLQVVVTGMHLLAKFGRTARAIEQDGFHIDAKIPMQRGTDDPLDQATGLARGVHGMAAFFTACGTDIVLVLGDRIEALAGALAAVTTGRALAHVHGGDVALGSWDDTLRHTITKLAHVHFAASKDAARRIIRLGEDPRRVHHVGAPGLDELYAYVRQHPPPVRRERAALVIVHPIGRRPTAERATMAGILGGTLRECARATVLYPNSDSGHSGIVEAIEEARGSRYRGKLTIARNLPPEEFCRALCGAGVIVGNSSCGVIEAAVCGTPAVNIGDRQLGRPARRSAVIHCGDGKRNVARAVREALERKVRPGRRSIYGDGQAGRRIAECLGELPAPRTLVRKLILI